MEALRARRSRVAGARAGRVLGLLLVASLGLPEPGLAAGAPPAPPNVLFLISDDLGWPYYGFMGSEIVRTPNLDRLAAEGFTFRNGFATSNVCAPALRSILTGLHPAEFPPQIAGDGDVGRAFREIPTLPRLLGAAGYRSFQGGKFWEGHHANAGFTSGLSLAWKRTSAAVSRAGGASAFFGRGSLDAFWSFVDEEPGTPFFAWLTPMLPHAPYDADEEYAAPYRERGLTPAAIDYYASVTRFDALVGALLDDLAEKGLREKTLIIYLSDNGYEMAPRDPAHRPPYGGPHGKLSAHDMGFRTPILLSLPGVVPEGRQSEQVVSAVDLFDTSLSAAGVTPPPGRRAADLWPYLTGRGAFPRSHVVGQVTRLAKPLAKGARAGSVAYSAWFVRTPEWRYVWHERANREELFRIAADPLEQHDVAGEEPDVRRALRGEALAWKAAVERVGPPEP